MVISQVQYYLSRPNYEFPATTRSDGESFKLLQSYAVRLQLERVRSYLTLVRKFLLLFLPTVSFVDQILSGANIREITEI